MRNFNENEHTDFFKILEVKRVAGDDEIKRAWRSRVKENSGALGVNPNREDTERLQIINLAYEAIKRREGRERYLEELQKQETKEGIDSHGPRTGKTQGRKPVWAEDFREDIKEAKYWEDLFRKEGYPTDAFWATIARETAEFHRDFDGFVKTLLGEDDPSLLKENVYGSLGYYLSSEKEQISLGFNNLGLLAAMVEVFRHPEAVKATVLQVEEGLGETKAVAGVFKQATISYEVMKGEGGETVLANPLQCISREYLRNVIPPKLNFGKTYPLETIDGENYMLRGLTRFVSALKTLAKAIATGDETRIISNELGTIRGWELLLDNPQKVSFPMSRLKDTIDRVNKEGKQSKVESLGSGRPEFAS